MEPIHSLRRRNDRRGDGEEEGACRDGSPEPPEPVSSAAALCHGRAVHPPAKCVIWVEEERSGSVCLRCKNTPGWMDGWMDEEVGGWVDGWIASILRLYSMLTQCAMLKVEYIIYSSLLINLKKSLTDSTWAFFACRLELFGNESGNN